MTLAEVFLWGTKVGTVSMEDGGRVGIFEYDRGFLHSGIEVSPIMMPLSERVYSFPELRDISFHGLPGMLADSLPDKFGNAVINSWLEANGRTPDSVNAVERLCYTGKRGMGALEFVPALGPDSTFSDKIELDSLVKLASDILSKREKVHVSSDRAGMEQILKVGTSAGGARAKAIIAWNEETGDIRSGQIDAGSGYGYWLIKFDRVTGNGDKEGEDPPQYTNIEYAYHLMAKAAGIEMEECRLLKDGDRYHFMTKRFDRTENGDKLHMQSLGALAHFDFNDPGVNSYEQAARIMNRLRLPKESYVQLFKRAVFNVLGYNLDDHVKNLSFLMDREGKWSFAPAYDLSYAYNPDGAWTSSHQMSVHGKRAGISRDDLLEFGVTIGLKKNEAKEALSNTEKAVKQWPEYAAMAGVSASIIQKVSNVILKS